MTMKDEIKACMLASLADRLDPYMFERGFSRSKTGLVYKRTIGRSTQKIDLVMRVHPKDNPNAAAAIYPQMEVLMPAVDAILVDMVGNNLGLLEGVTGGTSKQPIGFTSKKAHTGRWFIYQPDSVLGIVDDIQAFLERWTMPLLDVYTTPEDVIAADHRADARLANDRAQTMRVVAAALASKRHDYAQATMEKWLGAPGTRRRYEQVYDYIQRESP